MSQNKGSYQNFFIKKCNGFYLRGRKKRNDERKI